MGKVSFKTKDSFEHENEKTFSHFVSINLGKNVVEMRRKKTNHEFKREKSWRAAYLEGICIHKTEMIVYMFLRFGMERAGKGCTVIHNFFLCILAHRRI